MNVYICNITDFEDLAGLSLLTEERKTSIYRYVQNKDKQRCLCAGLMLRYIFGEKAEGIALTQYGKPYIKDLNIHFNISHAGDYVVLAVDKEQIGIDIEEIRDIPADVAQKCYLQEELRWLEEQATEKAFYMLWTAKESIMKACGKGFYMSPESFSVMPILDGFHNVNNIDWNLQWHEINRHILCVSSKTVDKIQICFLDREKLVF